LIYFFANSLAPSEDHQSLEPSSKRRKIGSHAPDIDSVHVGTKINDLLDLLRFEQVNHRYENIKPGHARTCRWLLTSAKYLDWLNPDKLSSHHGFFWLKGKPGSGKSTLTKFAFKEIVKSSQSSTVLSFFFNARGTHLEKSTIGLYRSLLLQLLEKFPECQRLVISGGLMQQTLDDRLQSSVQLLKELLAEVVQILDRSNLIVVVDALDECDEEDIRDMISFFERLQEEAEAVGEAFHVLFSSRHYPHITIRRSVEMRLEDQQGHSQDIEKYLSSELKIGRSKQVEKIRENIRDKASGVFMWIVLVVQILNKAYDEGHIHALQKKLREIPKDLNELFRQILTRDSRNMAEMKLCLQWVLHANRPLKREELYYAIRSGIAPEELCPWDPDIVPLEAMDKFILSSSKGLAEITRSKSSTVQFIHESVRDFLMKENGLSQVGADLEANALGLTHDRLKECCANYLQSIRSEDSIIPASLPKASSSKAAEIREAASRMCPFLEYSIGNLLAHADASQSGGVDQSFFLENFDLKGWVQLNNALERFQIRRHLQNADLLYVLAEGNHSNLIKTAMRAGAQIRSHCGRYGNPIFAAIAKDNDQALESLLISDSQTNPPGSDFPYLWYGNKQDNASPLQNRHRLENHEGQNPLSFFAQHGKPSTMHQFLSFYKVDTNMNLHDGTPFLHWAADKGYASIVELLLSQGADVNAQGGEYGNALQAALYRGKPAIVELLMSEGANINAQGGKYGNALQAASTGSDTDIVKLLLSKGADINAEGGYYGNALQAASHLGKTTIVELLLSKGAHVHEQGGHYGNALIAASSGGDTYIVELLLNNGADVNAQGGEYGNALREASAQGHIAIVELLLNMGADINAQGGHDGNALQIASYEDKHAVVELLLSKGANINAQGGYYGNALQAASAQDHTTIVELLLSKGADVNAQGGYYGNALQAASYRGNPAIIELLLSEGANINVQGGEYGNALQAASYQDKPAIVELLLSKGANVNAQGGRYGNALLAALTENDFNIFKAVPGKGPYYRRASPLGKTAIVQLLLSQGADVDAQGGEYGNALQTASYQGKSAIVELLLSEGANVNAKGGKYDNALQAASTGSDINIVKLLLSKGADVNAQGGHYGNALQAVSSQAVPSQGKLTIIKLLLSEGANINAQGGYHGNALQAASARSDINIVEQLLSKGADVNAQGGYHGNALQAASYRGNPAIIELLLSEGANVNAQGGKYGNALQAASLYGHTPIVKMLLNKGANVNAQGGKYDNALQAASQRGEQKIVQLLLENGAIRPSDSP
jgi:ankyrin repeat protein